MSKIVKEGVDRFFDYGIHVETKTIYMGSEDYVEESEVGTDHKMTEKVIKGLHVLNLTPDKPIKIIMNNLGGSWHHGMAIYDAIKASPCHITIEAMGHVMSMGSIIFQAADDRVIHPNATMMIHDGEDGYAGHAKNFEVWAKNSKKTRQKMYEIYAERSKQDDKYWEKRCLIDYIMDAKQAVAEGLADSVFGEEGKDGESGS